jgi:hypothetical protein
MIFRELTDFATADHHLEVWLHSPSAGQKRKSGFGASQMVIQEKQHERRNADALKKPPLSAPGKK